MERKQTSAEGLLSLPGEVLCRVFAPLSQEDLKVLTLVNKASHEAVKLAYRNVVVKASRLIRKAHDYEWLDRLSSRFSGATRLSFRSRGEEVDPKALAAFMGKMLDLEDLDVSNLRGVDCSNLLDGCRVAACKKLKSLTVRLPAGNAAASPSDAQIAEDADPEALGQVTSRLASDMSSFAEALPQIEYLSILRPLQIWSHKAPGGSSKRPREEPVRPAYVVYDSLDLRPFSSPSLAFTPDSAAFTRLKELCLESCTVDDCKVLAQKCPALVSLSLTEVQLGNGVCFCDCAMLQLETLKIVSTSQYHGLQKHLEKPLAEGDSVDASPNYPKLTSLFFNKSIPEGLKSIAKQVTSLELVRCTTPEALSEIQICKQLRDLRLELTSSDLSESTFMPSFLEIQQSCQSLQRVEVQFPRSTPPRKLLSGLRDLFLPPVTLSCMVQRRESSSVITVKGVKRT